MDTEDDEDIWPTNAQRARAIAQVQQLRADAAEGGLRFEAYLPPGLAEWLLDEIEREAFIDPSEAIFVMAQQFQELQPHVDLRRELLNRMLRTSLENSSGVTYTLEEVHEHLQAKFDRPLPPVAQWQRDRTEDFEPSAEMPLIDQAL